MDSGMIVNNDNTTDERRAYASGIRQATDVVEYWLTDHHWWNCWMLPFTIRTTLRGLRDSATYIEGEADAQDARTPEADGGS